MKKIKKIFSSIYHRIYYGLMLKLNKNLVYCNKIKGHLSLAQGIFLFNLVKKLPEKSTIVEIGAYLGRSTCFIAEGITNRNISLYTIDTFENQGMSEGYRDTYSEFKKNVSKYKNKINIRKGFSYELAKEFKDVEIDLLWIDACHEYEAVKRDINDWVPLVKKHGIICFDDYYVKGPNHRVKKAVNECIASGKLKRNKIISNRMMVAEKI